MKKPKIFYSVFGYLLVIAIFVGFTLPVPQEKVNPIHPILYVYDDTTYKCVICGKENDALDTYSIRFNLRRDNEFYFCLGCYEDFFKWQIEQYKSQLKQERDDKVFMEQLKKDLSKNPLYAEGQIKLNKEIIRIDTYADRFIVIYKDGSEKTISRLIYIDDNLKISHKIVSPIPPKDKK